jgi:hypothetical protein
MNVKLLRQVIKAILVHPKNTNMIFWVHHRDEEAVCGTTGCIAGWVVAKAKLSNLRQLRDDGLIQESASDLLEVDRKTGNRLFFVGAWPEKFHQGWLEAPDRKSEAKVIASRIRHFIKTKGKE